MPISRYVVLGVDKTDARTHPAYAGAWAVITPRSVKEGLVFSGFVMTDAFWVECARPGARGDAARNALLTTKRNASKGAPPRPSSLREVAGRVGLR